MPRFKTLLIILCLCLCQTAIAEVKILKANDSNDPNGPYTVAMIRLAIEHMDTPYTLEVGNENYTQARTNEEGPPPVHNANSATTNLLKSSYNRLHRR